MLHLVPKSLVQTIEHPKPALLSPGWEVSMCDIIRPQVPKSNPWHPWTAASHTHGAFVSKSGQTLLLNKGTRERQNTVSKTMLGYGRNMWIN